MDRLITEPMSGEAIFDSILRGAQALVYDVTVGELQRNSDHGAIRVTIFVNGKLTGKPSTCHI